jgi:cell division protein FtsB
MLNLESKKKIIRYVIFFLIFIILFGNKSMVTLIRQKIELLKLDKTLVNLELENRELRNKLYNLENKPSYLEQQARVKLGLIQPGEIKYKFVDKE